jgi:antitoxin (DNA-binding transcriptional repressor) of toxin-antitoxin stability system
MNFMSERTINTKELRASLPEIVRRVGRGERFTVLYRSRPAFRLIPIGASVVDPSRLADDPLYQAEAIGHSTDGLGSEDHDRLLYGQRE